MLITETTSPEAITIDAVEAAFLLGAAVDGQYPFDGGVTLHVCGIGLLFFKAGKLHREDGPAVMSANGAQGWFLNGKRHRENGPAVVYQNGATEWWVHGKEVEPRA
jgi:hypothetical protein